MSRLLDWLADKWLQFQDWWHSLEPCPKEEMGYTCRHRVLSNGQKECGDD